MQPTLGWILLLAVTRNSSLAVMSYLPSAINLFFYLFFYYSLLHPIFFVFQSSRSKLLLCWIPPYNFFYSECCLMNWWMSNLRFMRCAICRLHLLILNRHLLFEYYFWWLYCHWMQLICDWACPVDVSLIWNVIMELYSLSSLPFFCFFGKFSFCINNLSSYKTTALSHRVIKR